VDILLDSLVNTYGLYILEFNLNTFAKEYIAKLFSDKIAFYIQKKFDKIIIPSRDYKKKCSNCGEDLIPQILKKAKINEIYQENGNLFLTW
jgi:hypothetical protein